MPRISKTFSLFSKDVDVRISEVSDGIYRISGYNEVYGVTFNQFLINDEKPMLIHTGPVGTYKEIEEKVKEVSLCKS